MARKKDELLEDDYDGIKEFDNKLPGWWIWLFILTIVFSFFYLAYFHVIGLGDSSRVKYLKQIDPTYQAAPGEQSNAMLAYIFPSYKSPYYVPGREVMQQDLRGSGAAVMAGINLAVEEKLDTTVTPLTDAAGIAAGQKIFSQYCFTCHGGRGEGGIGPNLTDDFWIHGGSFPEIIHTIRKGMPVKGMISWETQLSDEQILQVGSFVRSIYGSNPPNAKAPQGEKVATAP